MRQNNKADMTVTEQIRAIRQKICSDYCKYSIYDQEGKMRERDITEQIACEHCPIREL